MPKPKTTKINRLARLGLEQRLDVLMAECLQFEGLIIELESDHGEEVNFFMARLCAHKAVVELRFVHGYLRKAGAL